MDPFVGEIRAVAFSFAPRGWAMCNGQSLSVTQNQVLFSLIGYSYGGDGNVFNLPNLQGRCPVGVGQGNGLSNYVVGQTAGAESVTLTSSQLPAHTHALPASSLPGTPRSPLGAVPADGGIYRPSGSAPVEMAPTGFAGGSQPVDIRQPYQVVNYIIALVGVFPQRP